MPHSKPPSITAIPLERLDEKHRLILLQIAMPIADGVTHAELAQRYGVSKRAIGESMKSLKAKLQP